jgi:hypothetical protein
MFVPCQESHCNLTLNAAVLRGEAFRRGLGRQGGALTDGMGLVFYKRTEGN